MFSIASCPNLETTFVNVHAIWHYLQMAMLLSNKTLSIKCYSETSFNCAYYLAMLCIRGTSHGPVSVCLSVCLSVSVTSRCSTKTEKRRITQTTPHDTPGSLVFWRQRSPRNSTGVTPYEGAECRWGSQNRRLSTNNRLYLENGKR